MRLRFAIAFLLASLAVPALFTAPVQDESSTVTRILRHNNLGVAWMDQLKFDEAAAEFANVIEADPRFVPGWVNRGLAHFYGRRDEEAVADLTQAVKLDPDQLQALYTLGLIHRNANQREKALESLLAVHERDPDDPATNYFLGSLYLGDRRFEKAMGFFERAIELQPYNRSAYYGLSRALMRLGRRPDAKRMLEEFRRLEGLSGTETVSQSYREQGRYAVAIDRIPEKYLPGRSGDPAAGRIEVRFVDATRESGLGGFRHAGKGASGMGSGLALGDYDRDGDIDIYFANASPQGARGALFRNTGSGGFENVSASSGIDFSGRGAAALWGDVDNDGDLDLYLVNDGPNALYRNDQGRFTDITGPAGVGDPSRGLGGVFVDSDHDGDLDILVANYGASPASPENAGAPNAHYRNNADGTFSDISSQSKLGGGARRTFGILASDFDNSRDIDFYVVNRGGANQLFSNLRDGTFEDVAAEASAAVPRLDATAVAVGDVNRDAYVDFALAGPSGRLLLNTGRRGFRSVPLPEAPSTAHSARLFDYDNDGDLDLLVVSAPVAGQSGPSRIQLFRYDGARFADATSASGLDAFDGRAFRGAAVADLDGDGDLDIVVNVNGGPPLFLRNEGGNANNWIAVATKGTNSNKPGIGTKVEIRSGDFHLKSEVYGGDGMMAQSPARVHFGLGRRTRADFLRLRWPGGVLQSELNPPVSQVFEVEELDRKGTSCPILYVHDGESYEYVTDFLGGSAYGYLLAPGVYNYPDTDEYLLLPRESVGLKMGRVAVSLNNQLEEVIFFDKAELVVVDHPADYSVVPDEKLLPGPPYDPFRLHALSRARPPLSARDGRGKDILAAVREIDRQYPDIFEELPFKGYATPHEIVLDLGELPGERAVLVMHAWIDYADSTSNLAASQAGISLQPPVLQVRDQEGRWKTVIERMGFPAGLPKPMTVDLSGKFLSESREVRIKTNMRIHWDRILVETGPAREDFRLTRLKAATARLDYHGFPEFSSPDGRQPKRYYYDRVSPAAPWKVHSGAYTRYGEVAPLLEEADDMYVITRSGDRIQAFFDTRPLPELPRGWVRDYLLYVDGFGKDMDINSASPDTVEPLPFHAMSSFPYPPGEHYPDSEAHRRYRETYNTRVIDGKPKY